MPTKMVNVLLVEDDEVDAEAVQRSFAKHRIANPVTVAKDGIEALEILRGDGDGRTPLAKPLLLIVDLNMPRMNGIELLRTLRADPDLRSTVAFVLTTSKAEEDKTTAYNLNVAGYLVKSNVGEDFIKMVNMLDRYWKVVEMEYPPGAS